MARIISADECVGKRIALLLWRWPDAAAAVGTLRVRGAAYLLEFPAGKPPFPLEIDWLLRLDKVIAETYDLFDGADYVLSLAMGDRLDSARPSALTPTGLIWPDDDA